MTDTTITREQLVDAILEFLAVDDLLTLEDVRSSLTAKIDAAGPGVLIDLHDRLTADRGWGYYPPDPLAREIHHLLAHRFLDEASVVHGARRGPLPNRLVVLANHLSYADANVIAVLLRRCGAAALADRLTAIAGPKVFSSRQRRFSSLCFGTIKVPQSTEVSSEEARSTAREVARRSRAALEAARERLDAGDALLLFAEGTRSRTGRMGRMLSGAARYLLSPGTWLLPVGLTGSEALFPIDSATVHPARASMWMGTPLRAGALFSAAGGDRRVVMDAVGAAVADLLPAGYRGVYGEQEFAEARAILERIRA